MDNAGLSGDLRRLHDKLDWQPCADCPYLQPVPIYEVYVYPNGSERSKSLPGVTVAPTSVCDTCPYRRFALPISAIEIRTPVDASDDVG